MEVQWEYVVDIGRERRRIGRADQRQRQVAVRRALRGSTARTGSRDNHCELRANVITVMKSTNNRVNEILLPARFDCNFPSRTVPNRWECL